ncbi:MAG: molecular chaperone TorD family protein [Gordonibacter sp.]|uniref:TorD/DmsD family molecular chaperone n=1 Tax=Gordonibacter sp. TaxID=1968902 RepID=UPI002FC58C06
MSRTPPTGQTTSTDLAYALGCADFFQLTSLFCFNPTPDLAQGILDGSVADDMQAIFEDAGIDPRKAATERLDEACSGSGTAEDLHATLRQDYTALFTHPKEPLTSLYEMQFRDQRDHRDTPSTLFLNEAALHAEQCYRSAGLALSDAKSREPGDHMGIELEFMAYLHIQLAAALSEGDAAAQERWEKAISDFLPHLESWGVDFFAACTDSKQGVVYPWLGTAGRSFLEAYLANGAS